MKTADKTKLKNGLKAGKGRRVAIKNLLSAALSAKCRTQIDRKDAKA